MKTSNLLITLFVITSVFACSDESEPPATPLMTEDPIVYEPYTFEYNGTKYTVYRENKSWLDAAEFAQSEGGKLVEINDQEEQDKIFMELTQFADINLDETIALESGTAKVWIGGNDIEEEGHWVWDGDNDGVSDKFWIGDRDTGGSVDSRYNNWGYEPDNWQIQNGLAMGIVDWIFGVEGEWNDLSVENQLYFVVEYEE
ncbi:MAG: C-type lectin domain-containing protein [Reichenbachiella sp.]|uniref:C-type lectin domain-containing protein n=1 Tax=Reichenbachiella sp. TaxID=2184521 RepID=UPI003299C88B